MGLLDWVKQARALRKEMDRLKRELASRTFQGASADGTVTAAVRGDMKLVRVTIARAVVEAQQVEKLEQSVCSAVNAALEKAQASAAEEMSRISLGLARPGMDVPV